MPPLLRKIFKLFPLGEVFDHKEAYERHPVIPCCDDVRVDRHEPVANILDYELIVEI